MVRETRHLWVGNLPPEVREDRIRDHFKRYGRVQSVKVVRTEGGGGTAATVSFMDIKSAAKAHQAEQKLDDRPLSTEYHEPPTLHHYRPHYSQSSGGEESSERHFYDREYPGRSNGRYEAGGGRRGAAPTPRAAYRPPASPQPAAPPPSTTERVRGWSGYEVSQSPSRYHQDSSYQGDDRLTPKVPSSQPLSKSSTGQDGGSSSVSTRSRSSSASSRDSDSSRDDDSSSIKSRVSPQQTSGVDGDRRQQPLAICVRNLPSRSSDTSLKDGLYHEYKKHGKVTWVKVVGSGSDRYAVVCFKRPDDVDKALHVSHDKLFFGCKIDVCPYNAPPDVEIDNDFRPFEADQDEYHPKATRTLFIGNLDKEISAQEIRKHFEQFGEILDIDVKKQGTSSSYAFCQYADIASVVRAMRALDGETVAGARVKLGFGKSLHTACVWVDGIAESVSEKYLSQHFSQFGPVAHVVIDRSRCQALITYEQVGLAQAAVKEMRGVVLRGRRLQVDFASRECQDAFYEHLERGGGREEPRGGYETPSSSGSSAGGGRHARCCQPTRHAPPPSSRQPRRPGHYEGVEYDSRRSYRSYEENEETKDNKDAEECLSGEETRRRCKHRSHGRSEDGNGGGSRPGTPLCDERPEPTEPRRPRSRPPAPPLSLPLPRFASQVLPPPSPPSSDDSQPSPPSPEWEARLRSLDERYQQWARAARPDPTTPRIRPRFLDPHDLQPSEIVKSLLAKPSVFDEDLKRLENFNDKYEPKELPSTQRSPPVPKGLQYPFPSHPALQPPVRTSTTRPRPPAPRPTEICKDITSSLLVSSIKPAGRVTASGRRDSEPGERRRSRDEAADAESSDDTRPRRASADEAVPSVSTATPTTPMSAEHRLAPPPDDPPPNPANSSHPTVHSSHTSEPPPPADAHHTDRKKDIFGVNSEKDRRRKDHTSPDSDHLDNLKIKRVPENKCDVIALKGNTDDTKSSDFESKEELSKPARRDSSDSKEEQKKEIKLTLKSDLSTVEDKKDSPESKENSLFKKVFGLVDNIRLKEKTRESSEKVIPPSQTPEVKERRDEDKKKDDTKRSEEARYHEKKKHSGDNKKKDSVEEHHTKDYEINFNKRKVIERCLTAGKEGVHDNDLVKVVKDQGNEKKREVSANFVEVEPLKTKDGDREITKKNKDCEKKNEFSDSDKFSSDIDKKNKELDKFEKVNRSDDHNKVKHSDKYKEFNDKKKHYDGENRIKEDKRKEERKDHDHDKNKKKEVDFESSRQIDEMQKVKREFDFETIRRISEDRCKKEYFENNRHNRDNEENKKNRKKDLVDSIDSRLPKSDLSGAERKKDLIEKERRRDRELVDGVKYGGDELRKNKIPDGLPVIKVNGDHHGENDDGDRKKRTDRVNSWPAAAVGYKRRLSSQEGQEGEEPGKKSKQERRDSKDSTKSTTSGSTPRRHDKQCLDEKHRKSSAKKEKKAGDRKREDKKKGSRPKENGTASESDLGSGDDEVRNLKRQHSIFDIVDDEPAYISMYDKVKARSTKNMQKQEEEKRQEKLKEKFSQLKQCRAKREEKKRSTSYDEDSDSERGSLNRRWKKDIMMLGTTSSDEDNMSETDKNRKLSLGYDTSEDERRHPKQDPLANEDIKARKILSDTSEDDLRHYQSSKTPNSNTTTVESLQRSQLVDKLYRKIASDTSEDDISRRRKPKSIHQRQFIASDEESDDHHLSRHDLPKISTKENDIFHANSPNLNAYTEIRDSESDNPRPLSSPDNNFLTSPRMDDAVEIFRKKKKQKKQKHFDNDDGLISKKHSKKDKRKSHSKEEDENAKKLKKKKDRENKHEEKMEDMLENMFGAFSDDSERGNIRPRISQIFASDSDSEHERKKEKRRKEKKARELDEAGAKLEANLLEETHALGKNKKKKRKKSRDEKIKGFCERFEEIKQEEDDGRNNHGLNSFSSKRPQVSSLLTYDSDSQRSSVEEEETSPVDNKAPVVNPVKCEELPILSPDINDRFNDISFSQEEEEKKPTFMEEPSEETEPEVPIVMEDQKLSIDKPKDGDEELRVKQHRMEEEAVESILPHSALGVTLKPEIPVPSVAISSPKTVNHLILEEVPISLDPKISTSPVQDKVVDDKAPVISQEETEDAVAALLMEDAFVSADVPFDNSEAPPFEDDDKPASPPSEPDLQIDTDTEEQASPKAAAPSPFLIEEAAPTASPPAAAEPPAEPAAEQPPPSPPAPSVEPPPPPPPALPLSTAVPALSPLVPICLGPTDELLQQMKDEPAEITQITPPSPPPPPPLPSPPIPPPLEETKIEPPPAKSWADEPSEGGRVAGVGDGLLVGLAPRQGPLSQPPEDPVIHHALPPVPHPSLPPTPAAAPPPQPSVPILAAKSEEMMEKSKKIDLVVLELQKRAMAIEQKEDFEPKVDMYKGINQKAVIVEPKPKEETTVENLEAEIKVETNLEDLHTTIKTEPEVKVELEEESKPEITEIKQEEIPEVEVPASSPALPVEEVKKVDEQVAPIIEVKPPPTPPPPPAEEPEEESTVPSPLPVKETKPTKKVVRRLKTARRRRIGVAANTTTTTVAAPPPSTQPSNPALSSADVYEFKEDSEEERPRLILTIKSPPAAVEKPHEKVHEKPPPPEKLAPAEKLHAASGPQTRKSRRLQEKDGRGVVEETAEDSGRWKRRATRNSSSAIELPPVAPPRKSPRRRGTSASAPAPAPPVSVPFVASTPTTVSAPLTTTTPTTTTKAPVTATVAPVEPTPTPPPVKAISPKAPAVTTPLSNAPVTAVVEATPAAPVPVAQTTPASQAVPPLLVMTTTSVVTTTSPPVITSSTTSSTPASVSVPATVVVTSSPATVITASTAPAVPAAVTPAVAANMSAAQGAAAVVQNAAGAAQGAASAAQPPTTLIDPVTGLLMPMQESEEGQYVPLHQFSRADGEPAEKRLKTENVRPSVVKQAGKEAALDLHAAPLAVISVASSPSQATISAVPKTIPTPAVPVVSTPSCLASLPVPVVLPSTTTITPVPAAHPLPPLHPVVTLSDSFTCTTVNQNFKPSPKVPETNAAAVPLVVGVTSRRPVPAPPAVSPKAHILARQLHHGPTVHTDPRADHRPDHRSTPDPTLSPGGPLRSTPSPFVAPPAHGLSLPHPGIPSHLTPPLAHVLRAAPPAHAPARATTIPMRTPPLPAHTAPPPLPRTAVVSPLTPRVVKEGSCIVSPSSHSQSQPDAPSPAVLSSGAWTPGITPPPAHQHTTAKAETVGPYVGSHGALVASQLVYQQYAAAAAAANRGTGGRSNRLSDTLVALLQRYPLVWQGLLALKHDQAAVQMHFVHGNPVVARRSLPLNMDGTTPPLRIAQRMRLEQQQIDGVARKMQVEGEHCMLLALPCGRDHMDVLQQSKNLQACFITYLQQKQAAGIINIAEPPSQQASYVVHIFPSCDFANEALARIAPDLLVRVADIAHLLIVIATV